MSGVTSETAPRARARPGTASLVLLGLTLARRGVMPVVAIIICAGTAVVLSALAVVLALESSAPPLWDIPVLASSALAWGGGFLLAFASAAHALHKDRASGIRHLLVARTLSLRGYLIARVGGLALLVALAVAGGTLLCGVVSLVAAGSLGAVPQTLQGILAASVYSLAFAAVMAPIALAALGARSRVGGYLFLLFVVVLPELLAQLLAGALPHGAAELLAVPSALAALRSALEPGGLDLIRFARALFALFIFAAFAVLLVRRDVALLEQPEADT